MSIFGNALPSNYFPDVAGDAKLAGKRPMLAALLGASLGRLGEKDVFSGAYQSWQKAQQAKAQPKGEKGQRPAPKGPTTPVVSPRRKKSVMGKTTALEALSRWSPSLLPEGVPKDIGALLAQLQR